jgi:CheY-like chemotaxis protein
MSHEIRTPLGVIIGFADLALDIPDTRDDVREYLRSIRRNGQQLVTLVGEVLDLSKIEANKLELESLRISLPDILDEVISSLDVRAKHKGITLTWMKAQKIPEFIVTDPTKLRQILMNLIGNAIKFTEKGEVRLTPRLISPAEPGAPIELEFLVEDTGIGIAADKQANLFKLFTQADTSTTRKYGGTGLGLVLSRQLAQIMGGSLELVRSEPGVGSAFLLRLPGGVFERLWDSNRSVERSRSQQDTDRAIEGSLPRCRILLVEDSVDNQVLISRYLKKAGAEVKIAADGAEAIEKAQTEEFDVILMDIQMPRVDGHEATRRLRDLGYQVPIIALTAHAFKEERDRALQGGFNGYLTKPVSRQTLVKTLSQVVSQ